MALLFCPREEFSLETISEFRMLRVCAICMVICHFNNRQHGFFTEGKVDVQNNI